MSKKRAYDMKEILADRGYDVPGRKPSNSEKWVNSAGTYTENKARLYALWQRYDMTQQCAFLQWEGLPNGYASWQINHMLYWRGSICAFRYGGNVLFMPYTIKGNLNVRGLPTEVIPIPFTGGPIEEKSPDPLIKGLSLPVDFYGMEREDGLEDLAYLLFDDVPVFEGGHPVPRHAKNSVIYDQIADALRRVDINIQVSNKKIGIAIDDIGQDEAVRRNLQAQLSSDSPYIIYSKGYGLESKDMQHISDFNADQLFNVAKNWDSIRCFMSGIRSRNFGIDKKERAITGELAGDEMQSSLTGQMRLALAESFCEKINKAFGLSVSVRLAEEDIEEQTDGRGMTKEEEEERADNE